MIPYGVGDMVVCIYEGPWNNNLYTIPPLLPLKGSIYVVRNMFTVDPHGVYVRLAEVVNPLPDRKGFEEAGFRADLFRPVKKTSIESLEKLTRDVPVSKVLEYVE